MPRQQTLRNGFGVNAQCRQSQALIQREKCPLSPQLGQFKVRVVEESTGEPMLGVSVSLLDPVSKVQVKGRQTNVDGVAVIEAINPGSYAVKISFIGMVDYEKNTVAISANKSTDIGTVKAANSWMRLL